ncbi:MAG: N-acetylneuraminate synthase family protein [Pseudomonadota bacterium]
MATFNGFDSAMLIAEIAQAHDGSLGTAHAYVDAAADAGADAIKFQMHIAEAESTKDEPWRTRFSYQDETRFDYWRRMEFTREQWQGLRDHAGERGLLFVVSPFSHSAIDLMVDIGVDILKIASGEALAITSLLPNDVSLPIIASTGMSQWREIDATIEALRASTGAFALLQCTSQYPTPYDRVGLNVMEDMRERYDCPVGLSDHSGTPYPALAALARGFGLIEVHVTFDRRMFGPDVSSSLTLDEFALVAQARDAFRAMDQAPVDKDAMAGTLQDLRGMFSKSLAVTQPLKAGDILERDTLTFKKPGTGIPASERDNVVGRRLKNAVEPDSVLTWSDVE